MKILPQIDSLYFANQAGKPMMRIMEAVIIAGEGIVGDRYAVGLGTFSKS